MKTICRWVAGALILAFALAAAAQGARPAPAEPPSIPRNVETYRLANGLEVILAEDHRLPIVGVSVLYKTGGALGHVLEHLMFEGSKHVGADKHVELLQSVGGTDVDGSTTPDSVIFVEAVPANQLELALWLESDRMGYLLDTVDSARLRKTIDVVRQERRTQEKAWGLWAFEEVSRQLYGQSHPYGASLLGSHANLEMTRPATVRGFFVSHFAPNNASLAIVGAINKTRAKALVAKYFESIPARQPSRGAAVAVPTIAQPKMSTIRAQVQGPTVITAWMTPPLFSPGDAEMDVLVGIVRSRLKRRSVVLASSFAFNQSMMRASQFVAGAGGKSGTPAEAIELILEEEMEGLRQNGPSAAEIDTERRNLESQALARWERLSGVARELNLYNYLTGQPDYFRQNLERYRSVTLESVKMYAQKYLAADARVVVTVLPGDPVIEDVPRREDVSQQRALGIMPDEPWRQQPPAPAAVARQSQLALEEILEMLGGEVPAGRIASLVKQYGVNFLLTDDAETRLRKAGANDALLLEISKARN